MRRVPVFDLDGTLLDSDAALLAPFVALGVPAEAVTFGHLLADECRRLDLDVARYLSHYDVTAAQPFPGVDRLLARLDRWAVCSNKHPQVARAELARLRWDPPVALFADAFHGAKRLEPVLEALALTPADVLFVGDTDHDRECAAAVGTRFVLAGWNPRAVTGPGDVVAAHPDAVIGLLDHWPDP